MRFTQSMQSTARSMAVAAVLVGGTAAAPFVLTDDADARPGRGDYTSDVDNRRPLHRKRGPFYGIRVNSMDFDGEAKVLASYSYRCPPLGPDGTPEVYHVVRSIQADTDVDVTDCDEVLERAFGGRDVTFSAVATTTRWIRDTGPNGTTPVGGFLGHMDLDATFAGGPDGTVTIPMLDFRMIGTQGLRPRRGDPDASSDPGEVTRCDAPFHDEGYYDARVDPKGLRKLVRRFGDDNLVVDRLRRLGHSVIAGTFEGRTFLAADRERAHDFAELDRVVWWMDGVVGFQCRPPDAAVDTRPDAGVDAADDAESIAK